MKYIYHHLGLGDHIICNGLVRSLINKEEEYTIFVKPHNKKTVEFMYRDLPNLKLFASDDGDVHHFFNENNIPDSEKIVAGFAHENGYSWDEVFYYQHQVDFKKRWESFRVERDNDREEYLFNLLNPNNDEYILIHSEGSDGVDRINYDLINDKYKKIYVKNLTENMFDYFLLVERAKEVHCVESSFHVLLDSVDLNKNLYFHTIHNGRGFSHKIREIWNIV